MKTYTMLFLATSMGVDALLPPGAGYNPQSTNVYGVGDHYASVGDHYASVNELYTPDHVPLNDFSNKETTKRTSPDYSDVKPAIVVQGDSLRTWSYESPFVEQAQVVLTTMGRPLDAEIELWQGPDNTPCKMRVYSEDGNLRPFSAVIATPRSPNTFAIRNIGQSEFPFTANVYANVVEGPSRDCATMSSIIQGGALRTYPFDVPVESVEVLLRTDGRPLNARIELLQGPNNNKQVIELYNEDGFDRPFFCILKTPGIGNVVRVVNTAPIEFPMTASVVAHSVKNDYHTGAVVGRDPAFNK